MKLKLKFGIFDYFYHHFGVDKTEEHITWNCSDRAYHGGEFFFPKSAIGDLSINLDKFLCLDSYYDSKKYYKLNGIVYTLGFNEQPPIGIESFGICNSVRVIFVAGAIYLCAQQNDGAWSLFTPSHDMVKRRYGDKIELMANKLHLCQGYKTSNLDSFAKENFAPIFEIEFFRGKSMVKVSEKIPNLRSCGFANVIPSLEMYEKVVHYIRNVICEVELQKLSDASLLKKHGFDEKSFRRNSIKNKQRHWL